MFSTCLFCRLIHHTELILQLLYQTLSRGLSILLSLFCSFSSVMSSNELFDPIPSKIAETTEKLGLVFLEF